jgi:hypothetical protein
VRFVSRQGRDLTRRFPELGAAVEALEVPTLLLDGEIAVFYGSGPQGGGAQHSARAGFPRGPQTAPTAPIKDSARALLRLRREILPFARDPVRRPWAREADRGKGGQCPGTKQGGTPTGLDRSQPGGPPVPAPRLRRVAAVAHRG